MSPRGKRLSASERRAQLIDVGRSVFAKHGYEGTSVEEIAQRAKVSKPIVYEHFGGKEGLYAVVVDREMSYVVRRITEAIAAGTPRERVERASLAFLTYVRDYPDGFAVLSQDSPMTASTGTLSSASSTRSRPFDPTGEAASRARSSLPEMRIRWPSTETASSCTSSGTT